MNFNNQKIDFREFHINEFPQDKVFVYLEEDFHKRVFSKLGLFRFKKFNQEYFENKLNYSTFENWNKRMVNLKIRTKKCFIPLWFIVRLSELFPEFSIVEFEKSIVAIKGPSASSVINNPNLPLKEDYRLLKILAHLLGDGHVGGGFGSGLPKGWSHSEYRNFTPELLDSFERDLSVFGEVPVTKNYSHGSLIIPNLIGYTLEHIYQIKFDTFNSRIPNCLYNLPKEIIASFFRAFGDDEGHVYDSSIDYYSSNKELIEGILVLINKNFPEIKTSGIKANAKAGKNTKYSLTIFSESQELYLKLIGFDHEQKGYDLAFNLQRKRNRMSNKSYEKGEAEMKILNVLKEENATAKQISRKIMMGHAYVLHYLKRLHKQGKVGVARKEHWANVWRKTI